MSTQAIRSSGSTQSRADRALQRIAAEIVDGLRHGYFDFRVTCEMIGQGRRRLVLHAGKSYMFVLAAEECTADRITGDPQHADTPHTD